MRTTYDIAVIPGDGIGPEVVGEALRVLERIAALEGFTARVTRYPFGAEHYLATQEVLPDSAFEEIRGHSAILLGAIGDPRIPVGYLEFGIIARLRFGLDLYVNLRLLGWIDNDLTALPEYCELVSRTTGVPVPPNYPVVGLDAFRTGTGVHAAAVIKAFRKGQDWLADRIYSGVPASLVGRRQQIEVGPMSGESNVVFWLQSRGLEPTPERVRAVFQRAKSVDRMLSDQDIHAVLDSLAETRVP